MTQKGLNKRNFMQKKRYWIPLSILLILVVLRIMLPHIVKQYVNKSLASLPEYYGQVEEIDIALYRGSYTIKGLFLNKVNAETQVPFLKFPSTDISVEWRSLLKGKIVAEILMQSPEVIYIFEDQQKEVEGEEADIDDWTKVLTDLVPLEINHFEVNNGKLGFAQITSEPQIDLYMDQVAFTAQNLRNVAQTQRNLPSTIKGTGVSIGRGNFTLEGGINLIKEVPDLNIDFSLQNADITAINDLTSYYGGVDFKSGTAELYGEIAIADGFLKGYIKPLAINTTLLSKEDGILETIWEGFVGLFKFILKNQRTDTLALKVPLEGDLNNVKAGILPTVISIFKNGWIQAFKTSIDEDINFKDAENEADKALQNEELSKLSGKERREYKKEQRIENRKQRKAQREGNNQ